MPAKDDTTAPAEGKPSSEPRYRRPGPEQVRAALDRLVAHGSGRFASQNELRVVLLKVLRRGNGKFALGPRRLRSILVEVPGVRIDVAFTERPTRRPLTRCPVCSRALAPIRNRTLYDDRVTLGYRCAVCGYWTHLRRRVPVRYRIRVRAPRGERPVVMLAGQGSAGPVDGP